MFDSKKADDNGLVRVKIQGGWLLVAITGTAGAGNGSHWKGSVVAAGDEQAINDETARRTQPAPVKVVVDGWTARIEAAP